LWKFKEAVGLLRATTKPTVLVIGQDKVDGYFRVFHLANLGVLPYDDALLVKGGPNADAYSSSELKNFDLVVLEGYSYKNRSKGWKILDEYVKNGGSLVVNTGWQYSSADWQLRETADFFPLKTLKWLDPGTERDYEYEGQQIVGEIDISKFGPLIYESKPWHISSSERSDLRDWAKVLLSIKGRPVVAGGEYGLGKVVWMGFDLPGHIGAYQDNEEEIKLYKNLIAYLLEGKQGKELEANFVRNYPDKLEIILNASAEQKTAVYWSEAYYPDFKAKFSEDGRFKKIKAYKAGPGMTLFILPKVKSGTKIIYEYKTPLAVIIARLTSLVTLSALLLILVKPELMNQIRGILAKKGWGARFKRSILGSEDEDINY